LPPGYAMAPIKTARIKNNGTNLKTLIGQK